MRVETPLPLGPSTTVLTFAGIGSGSLGEAILAIDANVPVLIDKLVLDKRFLRRSKPRGLLAG